MIYCDSCSVFAFMPPKMQWSSGLESATKTKPLPVENHHGAPLIPNPAPLLSGGRNTLLRR